LDPTCPVCRAALRDDPVCYRCRADLSALFQLEGRAAFLLSRARGEYGAGCFPRALTLTRESLSLCNTEPARDLETLLLFRTGEQIQAYAKWRRSRIAADISLTELLEQISRSSKGAAPSVTLRERPRVGGAPYLSGLPARATRAETTKNAKRAPRGAGSMLARAFSSVRNRLVRLRRSSG
jgi:hypothetical protein